MHSFQAALELETAWLGIFGRAGRSGCDLYEVSLVCECLLESVIYFSKSSQHNS